jgi:hypothetical protein
MNQAVNLIYQSKINKEFFLLLEIGQLQMFNQFQVLLLLLLEKIVSVGE